MPFLSAIGGAVSAVLGTVLGRVAVGIGLNVIASKIERDRAKKAQKAAGGTQFDKEYGETVSRKVAIGVVGIAGHDCYVNTYGKANKYVEQGYAFSDFPCDGLSKIYAGGKQLSIATTDGKNYTVTSGDYAGRMTFVFYDGTQTAADAGLVANGNPAGRWKAASIGSGICYLIARMTYDQEKLAQLPDFFFELRGARLYDIRKDSTAGGSGAHRWGQYSTYEFSDNPIVADYNYRRGFSWNGDLFLGMDMPASDLPFTRYVTAQNICDEIAGGERRYRCSIMLDADLDHGDNIDALMMACGGIVIDSVDGSWPLIGTEQPIVATFTDADLVANEKVKFRRRRSMGELVNVVSGTYPEPSNMWSPAGYDPQTNPLTVAVDRRTRDVSLNFPQVPSKRQANQLASIYFNENRYEATAEVVLRPAFRSSQAGDWVYWDSANEKRRGIYMVQSRSIRALDSDGPRNVSLSLQARDGAIYAGVGTIAPTTPLPNGDPVYLNELQDWAVIPVVATGADGRSYPAFRLSWSAIDDVTVRGVNFEWWVANEPQNKFRRRVEADETISVVQEGILNVTDYQFRHKLIADRVTNWIGPKSVTSIDGGSNFLVELEDLADEIRQDLETLGGWINDDLKGTLDETVAGLGKETSDRIAGAVEAATRYRSLINDVGTLRDYVAEQDFANYRDREQLRQTITARFETGFAGFDERITVAASATGAVSQRVTTLEVKATDLAASIFELDEAMVDGDQALAQQISLLSAGTDNQFDPVALWGFDTSVEGWSGNGAPSLASGFLRPANVGADPYVLSPAGLAVAASKYRQVRLRIRKYGAPVWEGFCWWKIATDAGFDASRRTVVAEPPYDANGIGLITFNPEWSGTIDQIRLDLSAAQSETDYFTIDWISIGSPSPGASRAELASERQARITRDSALTSNITALEASINDPKTGLGAIASGVSAVETRVTNLNGLLTAQGEAINALGVGLDDKADLDVVEQLSAEVAAIGGGGIVSQGKAITAIRNSIWPLASEALDQDFANFMGKMEGLKVTANASNALDNKIELTNTSIDIVARAVVQVQAILPGLASSEALSALSSRVTASEGSISSQSSAITSIRSDIGGLNKDVSGLNGDVSGLQSSKASVSALNALTGRVSETEDGLEAVSDSLTNVEARIDGVSASSTFRMTAVAGPSGYARIAAQARASTADGYRTAGWYLDVPSDPSEPTQFLITADRFAILNGSSKKKPFVVQDGELVLAVGNIGLIRTAKMEGLNGKMTIDVEAGTIVVRS